MKNFINAKVTIPKGYVVIDSGNSVRTDNLQKILKLAAKLEKSNLVMTSELTSALMTLDDASFTKVVNSIKDSTRAVKGQFLKSSFASGADLDNEQWTVEEMILQMYEYCLSYGLNVNTAEIFGGVDESRKIEIANVAKRKDKQDINNTFKILDVKTPSEFQTEVGSIVGSPIVWGAQQVEFIQAANDADLLYDVLVKADFKVKENMFSIINIVGKENVKELNIFKTATDALRYAYFVSGQDWRKLPKGVKFKLKTSDKKVIMAALNKLNVKVAFGDMKPYKSQWLAVATNLFPGSSKFARFATAQGLFDYLRNGGNVETFNTKTEALIAAGDMIGLAKHLKGKPGELMRRLDMIIRNLEKGQADELVDILNGVTLNPKLVTQVRKWLAYRTETSFEDRTFKVKGKPVTVQGKSLAKLKSKRTMKVVQALRGVIVRHLEGKDLFSKQLAAIEAYEAEQEKLAQINETQTAV